ncbi:MAG: hypothetical protein R2882_04975 [Gemmatimonadales bacterium]
MSALPAAPVLPRAQSSVAPQSPPVVIQVLASPAACARPDPGRERIGSGDIEQVDPGGEGRHYWKVWLSMKPGEEAAPASTTTVA